MNDDNITSVPPTSSPPPPPSAAERVSHIMPWEREVLERVITASLTEQRRARRWGIFFKSLTFLYITAVLLMAFSQSDGGISGMTQRHTALIDIDGIISADDPANADSVVESLRNAFENTHVAGIILRINSPGGSPVQAGYVNDEITRLRKAHPKVPVYAVIGDICASGGYYIAVAAEKIYADKGSLVGSIGVLTDGFGFTGTMEKLGIERRLLTAGENKGFLDPFSPANPAHVEHMKGLLNITHQQFINVVKQGRGTRLKDDPQLFSGLIWNGEQAKALGLIDDLGSPGMVARDIFKAKEIVDYTQQSPLLQRFAERLGMAMGRAVMSTMSGFGNGLK